MGPRRRARGALGHRGIAWPSRTGTSILLAVAAGGCATIHVTPQTEIRPDPKRETQRFGRGHREVEGRLGVRWVQAGHELWVQLHEQPRCREQFHDPVIHVQRQIRSSDHTLWLEIGLTAGIAAFSAYAFRNPEAFGGEALTEDGQIVTIPDAGYQVGGIFAGMAAIGTMASIYDLSRLHDLSEYKEAYLLRESDPVDCGAVRWLVDQDLELVLGSSTQERSHARTDPRGRARLWIPQPSDPAADLRPASLRVGDQAITVGIQFPLHQGPLNFGERGEPRPLELAPMRLRSAGGLSGASMADSKQGPHHSGSELPDHEASSD